MQPAMTDKLGQLSQVQYSGPQQVDTDSAGHPYFRREGISLS